MKFIKLLFSLTVLITVFNCSSKEDNSFEETLSSENEPQVTNLSIDTWTKYCGWHYSNQYQPNWSGWVREFAKDGFGLNITDTITNQLLETELNNSFNKLTTLNTTKDVLQLVGGLGSAKDTTKVKQWMSFIENDNASQWKNIVYQQSVKLTDLNNAKNRVYWQLGNEISSPSYSKTIRYWQGQPYSNGIAYDAFIIPYYVENFLAPTIEAIDQASLDVYGEKGLIKICLGSLTNASSASAQSFLNQLLNYEIIGTNANSLTNKKVIDLIHLITIHYTAGTAPTTEWKNILNHYKDYSGISRIEGVWSTEEVGIQTAIGNAGGIIGSLATFRYLEWAIENEYSSKEVRTNYYGWNTGNTTTTTNYFNTFLYEYLGDVKLKSIANNSIEVLANNSTEIHAFKTEDESKNLISIYPERSQSQTTANIQSVLIDKASVSFQNQIKVYIVNSNGINPINFELSETETQIEINFSNSVFLDYYSGIILFID